MHEIGVIFGGTWGLKMVWDGVQGQDSSKTPALSLQHDIACQTRFSQLIRLERYLRLEDKRIRQYNWNLTLIYSHFGLIHCIFQIFQFYNQSV